jgi:DNA repair protein SbcC/Rad50
VKLQKLRVQGVRSFTQETEIDLGHLGEQGLFAIFGPTGAGKSTILDGIFLALFGRCPRGEASECVSSGALDMVVRLELSLDRDEAPRLIAVERRFHWSKKRGAAAGAIGADLRGAPKHPPLRIEEKKGNGWEPIDLGGKKPDELLSEQIVRVSISDFQQAVVLPQGEFDVLLRARPADRRILVASLFRTERLGKPLLDALKVREEAVLGEMDRLEEAAREIAATTEEAAAAAALAEQARIDAEAKGQALAEAERLALDRRLARERCAAKEAAAEALAAVEQTQRALSSDRARARLGQQAAGAEAALLELSRCDTAAQAAELRAMTAGQAANEAEATQRRAARALAEATETRALGLPEVLEKLGRARLALLRGQDLSRLEGERAVVEQEHRAALAAFASARAATLAATAELQAIEAEERAAAAALAEVKVGEDERAEAIARVALGELRAAEERAARLAERERAAAEERARGLEEARAAGDAKLEAAATEGSRRHAEQGRAEAEAQRAAAEAALAEQALDSARRAAAAAEIAKNLGVGAVCPVCGSREHPAKMETGPALYTLDLAERAREATKRIEKAAEHTLASAVRGALVQDDEIRTLTARRDALAEELALARAAAARLALGEEVPRAVAEASAESARLRARADLALGALSPAGQETARAASLGESLERAEAAAIALARRAREAEILARALAEIRERAARARVLALGRNEDLTRHDHARLTEGARFDAATSLIAARREEIHGLLAALEPAGQHDLFTIPDRARTAAQWIDALEARSAALTEGEESARTALDEARAAAERLTLEAREASARRDEATDQLVRARQAIRAAMVKAGFESLDALRRARVDPEVLAALTTEIDRTDQEQARLSAIFAARERDAQVTVSEEEASLAERARDEARKAAHEASERAAHTLAHRDELARRRLRAVEIRAKIALLEPRAKRLGQIRLVVASNQLSELAAERHLEAVTRGAATILRSLSSDRYALVRTADGAFAVADSAHGGLVRAPSTLSGGETFLVSLALALSLSERIQLAGRTRFDFFFLDEGFGSLDAATLEVALNALERLRGPHRVIGMISHVAAIEERMPRKLRVTPGRSARVTHSPLPHSPNLLTQPGESG